MIEADPSLLHASLTDVGKVREVNEDAFGSDDVGHGRLFVVADGMGGHQSGDVASRLAVKSIIEGFRDSTAIDPSRRLLDALKSAHERIMARQGQRTGRDRMGTTAVALYISPDLAHYAWVGDSRIYLVREGQLSSITRDHTVGRELLERGVLGPDELVSHPDGHKLSRALGMERQWQPECAPAPLPLEAGDMFLLCTDGLYKFLPEGEVLSVLLAHDPEQAAGRLVELANERGGGDNITVQLVRVGTREAAVEAAAREGHIGSLTMELQALVSTEAEVEVVVPTAPSTAKLGPGEEVAAVQEPQAEVSQAEESRTEERPIEETQAEEPPTEEPEAEESPTEEPPAEEPQAEEPPAEEPQAEEPQAEEPPPEASPAGEPTVEEPQAEEPRSEASPPEGDHEPRTRRIGPGDTAESHPALPLPSPDGEDPVADEVTEDGETDEALEDPEPMGSDVEVEVLADDRPQAPPRAAALPAGPRKTVRSMQALPFDPEPEDAGDAAVEQPAATASGGVPTPRAVVAVDAAVASGDLAREEDLPHAEPRVARYAEPAHEGRVSKLLVATGVAIGLLFVVLLVSLIGVAFSVVFPRSPEDVPGFTSSTRPGDTTTSAARDSEMARAAASIRSIPELEQCDQQWSLLREHRDVLAGDAYTMRDIAGRVYRCYDHDALTAVEAFHDDPSDVNRKDARTKIGHARRFLEPGSRADDTLKFVAAAVAADLGPAEVEQRLAEVKGWEASL